MKWPNKKLVYLLVLAAFLGGHPGFSQGKRHNNAVMLRQAATMYERAGQYKLAADYYIRACRENPGDVSSYLGAKRMLDRLQDYDRFEALILALQKRRRDVRYPVDLALVQFKRGNHEKALEKWRQVLEENPKSHNAYSLVGQAMIENRLYEDAVKVYQKGRTVLKSSTAFTFELASIYKALNQYDDLVEEYANYLTANPGQVNFIESEIQRLAREEGTLKPLISEMQRAMKRHKDIEWALHLFLGDLYMMDKSYEKSLQQYLLVEKKIVDVDDKRVKAGYKKGKYVYNFGDAALQANHPDEAEQAFQIVIRDFADGPYRAKAELGLTQVYLQRQAYEEAIQSLERFIDNNKKSLDSRRALIMIGDIAFENLFRIDRAEQAYRRAFDEYPNNRFQAEALFKLAECAVARDDLPLAESYLRKALQKAGSKYVDLKKYALLGLARLEFYRGRPQASLRFLQQFSELSQNDAPDVLENDALQLMITLQENSRDSTSLAVLGRSQRLAFQRKHDQAISEIESYLHGAPNVLLRSELRMQLVDEYRALGMYDKALAVLTAIYDDRESLYRDAALMKAGEILQLNLNDAPAAQEKYETVLVEFPNSVYLEQARLYIRNLREKKEKS